MEDEKEKGAVHEVTSMELNLEALKMWMRFNAWLHEGAPARDFALPFAQMLTPQPE